MTCHDGAPPAGVSYPPTASGTGYDKSAFSGTMHDLATGSDSCRHCHEAHGSAYLAMLKAEYVTDDYNPYDTGDGDYAACWLCHDEDIIVEQTNAFKDRHQKHVKGARAPCIICHDVHAGYEAGEPGLINFAYPVQSGYDIEFIDGKDGGTSFWIDTQADKGNCYISCHYMDHKPKDYERQAVLTFDCSLCHASLPG